MSLNIVHDNLWKKLFLYVTFVSLASCRDGGSKHSAQLDPDHDQSGHIAGRGRRPSMSSEANTPPDTSSSVRLIDCRTIAYPDLLH